MDVSDNFSVRRMLPQDLKTLGKLPGNLLIVRGSFPTEKSMDYNKCVFGIYQAGQYGFPQSGGQGIALDCDQVKRLATTLDKLIENGEVCESLNAEQRKAEVERREHELMFTTRI